MADDKQYINLIFDFCKVTGADSTRARQCLEATGWDYDLAISSYYEENENAESNAEQSWTGPSANAERKKATPSTGSRIATYSSLRQNEDSDEEEGQAFYAGGSDRSGQQILGPSKRKAANEIVQEMLKAVETFGTPDVEPSKKSSTKLKPFRGAGYCLGSSSQCSGDPDEGPSEPLEVTLRLWQTGFTVDDGPLREYSDPQNKEFLDIVRRGEIPLELHHRARGGEIDLKLENHSHEEYIPKKPQRQAFAGSGVRLGNITPVVASQGASSDDKNIEDAQKSLNVDGSEPTTSIQIRLADGSRLTMQANYTHNIGDIRRFIVEARPEYATAIFSLMTSFPPKELTDDNATLEAANLLSAVIVQKLKM